MDSSLAREVIDENIARPSGFSVEQCSRLITEKMEDTCAQSINRLIKEKGYNPNDFVLFSFGGAGGLYCCAVADKVGIPKIYCSQFSSVFSAFGSSCADVLHSYESFSRISIKRQIIQSQIQKFNEVVKRLMNSAWRDMRGEGFPPEKVSFSTELEIESGNTTVLFESPVTLINGQEDIDNIFSAFTGQNNDSPAAELNILNIRLRARSPAAHQELPVYESVGENPEEALKGTRDVYWKDSYIPTLIYEQARLKCGNVVLGPAIIESDDTTILIPAHKKYTVDYLLNGVIEPA